MRRVRDRVAGIDVHRDTAVVCCQLWAEQQLTVDKQTFSTTATGLRSLRDWLAGHEIELVVMEATGDYWKPVFYPMEGLFGEVWVVNAQHVKNVPGRKTDMADAQWLATLARAGLLRASFIPPLLMRQLRLVARQRQKLRAASSARGSTPYTATQPISHQAHARWTAASAPAEAPAWPTRCTADASGTGKPSAAGSRPVS